MFPPSEPRDDIIAAVQQVGLGSLPEEVMRHGLAVYTDHPLPLGYRLPRSAYSRN